MRRSVFPMVAVAVFTLSGCTVGPEYVRPDPKAPLAWNAAKATDDDRVRQVQSADRGQERSWWAAFNDPMLDQFIDTAVTRNLDLRIARARVLEARASRGVSAAQLYPEINLVGTGERGNRRLVTQNRTVGLYDAGFDAAWEIDLFGGTRSRVQAADALVEASVDEERNTLLTLRAEVARNYLELRDAQTRLQVTRENTTSRRDVASLTATLRRAGLRSELDVSQARSQFLALEPQIPVLVTAIDRSTRRIEVLLGEAPGALSATLAMPRPVPVPGEAVWLADPVSVLARRPDVGIAERRLASATALNAAAVAELYPKVSLAGLVGYRDATGAPSFGIWSIAGAIAAPIFNAGRIRSQIDAADARRQEALASFEQTVLLALEEVEVNLVSYLNAEETRKGLVVLVENEEDKLALADDRYRRGLTGFIDVLEAQRSLQESQISLARAQGDVGRTFVALNKSLGR